MRHVVVAEGESRLQVLLDHVVLDSTQDGVVDSRLVGLLGSRQGLLLGTLEEGLLAWGERRIKGIGKECPGSSVS